MFVFFFFLMIRRPPRSTLDRSSAASDVYKRQVIHLIEEVVSRRMGLDALEALMGDVPDVLPVAVADGAALLHDVLNLSLIHISEPTRPY